MPGENQTLEQALLHKKTSGSNETDTDNVPEDQRLQMPDESDHRDQAHQQTSKKNRIRAVAGIGSIFLLGWWLSKYTLSGSGTSLAFHNGESEGEPTQQWQASTTMGEAFAGPELNAQDLAYRGIKPDESTADYSEASTESDYGDVVQEEILHIDEAELQAELKLIDDLFYRGIKPDESAADYSETSTGSDYGGVVQEEILHVDEAELQAELKLIDELVIDDSPFELEEAQQRGKRHKRQIIMANNLAIKRSIAAIANEPDFDENFRRELNKIYQKLEEKERYWQIRPNAYDSPFLVEYLKALRQLMDLHAQDNNFNNSYHLLYLTQMKMWKLAAAVAHKNPTIGIYRASLMKGYDDTYEKDLRPLHDMQNNEIDAYLLTRQTVWSRTGITSNDTIIIYNKEKFAPFTLTELFNNKHLDFMRANRPVNAHRASDNAGGTDPETEKFVNSIITDRADLFYKSAKYKEFIKFKAQGLYGNALAKLQGPQLYFDKRQTLNNIIEQCKETPVLMTDIGNQDLIAELTQLSDGLPAWTEKQITLLIYALAEMKKAQSDFPGVDLDKAAEADYIYAYRDDDGNEQFDTSTLAEILCQDEYFKNIKISHRKEVKINFPLEYGPDFIWEKKNLVNKKIRPVAKKISEEIEFDELRLELTQAMPSVTRELERVMKKYIPRRTENRPHLNDQITLNFKSIKGDEDVILNTTIAQVILGSVEKTSAKYYSRSYEITSIPAHTGYETSWYNRLIVEMKGKDVPHKILRKIQEATKNSELKIIYEKYYEFLSRPIRAKDDRFAIFQDIPNLHIYFDRLSLDEERRQHSFVFNLSCYESNAVPLHLFSIITGDYIRFNSMAELRRLIRSNADLAHFVKAHSYVDESRDLSQLELQYAKTSTVFEQAMDFYYKNADKQLTTKLENILFRGIEVTRNFASILLIPAGEYALPLEIAVNTIATGAQGFILTDKEDQNKLIREYRIELVETLISEGAGRAGSKYTGELFNKIAAKTPSALTERTSWQKVSKGISKVSSKIGGPADSQQVLQKVAEKLGEKAASKLATKPIEWAYDKIFGEQPEPRKLTVNSAANSLNVDTTGNLGNGDLRRPSLAGVPGRAPPVNTESPGSNTNQKARRRNPAK